MNIHTIIRTTVLAFGASILASCSSTGGLATGYSEAEEPTSSVAMRTGLIDPRSGKVGAPVSLGYQLPKSIAINGSTLIELEFNSSTGAGTMDIALNADTGLILSGVTKASFALDGSTTHKLAIPLYTAEPGLFYLNVMASEISTSGQPLMTRAFAVPVLVGDIPQDKPDHPDMSRDKNGELLIQMGAEETISH